ncbi:MAG: 30S ribosomal protein S3 [Acidimicrobiia bacterium]|nr:30S ribosomal protein S3 [Acidimicrobiia bacterium]
MGQKVHPYGLRLGIVTDWKSRWYSEKDYAAQVNEDARVRKYLFGELTRGAVSRIDIERIGDKKVQIDVHTARPGVVIGRSGSEADRLRRGLEDLTNRIVKFNVIEVQNPELDAKLLSRSVADQLEGRVSFRRAMKRAVQTALKAGAEGVRVQASGRLGGADMGRREWYLEGRVPLHTLRADVDFGQSTASTTVGAIGVKVWVYKGDVIPSLQASRDKIAAEARLAAGGPSQRRRSAKSRAEAPEGRRSSRLIEAGGGKRLVEAGGGKRKEGGKRLIEAGGGRRLTKSDAVAEFEEAKAEATEEVDVAAAAAAAAAADAAESSAVSPQSSVDDAAAPAADVTEAIDDAVDAEEPEPVAAPEADSAEEPKPEAAAESTVEAAAEPSESDDVATDDGSPTTDDSGEDTPEGSDG